MAAADVAKCGQQRVTLDAQPIGQGQQQMLDRQVLVAHVDPLAVGCLDGLAQCAVDVRLGSPEGLR